MLYMRRPVGRLYLRFLHRRLRGFCSRLRSASAGDADARDLDRIDRLVPARVGRLAGDLLYQLNRRSVALSEDGVVIVEVWRGDFGDEELRAVRCRTGVGHGEASRAIEGERRVELILKGVAGRAGAIAGGVAALD